MDEKDEKIRTRLRKKAEEMVQNQFQSIDVDSINVDEVIHDLRVYQIELEMQNEELREAQIRLEDSRSKYYDLYNFAPVGYFTIDKNGLILEVNLKGASILGVERKDLYKRAFINFITPHNIDKFQQHSKNAMETGEKQTTEIKMIKRDNHHFYAHLESTPYNNELNIGLKIALFDISKRKKAERESFETKKFLESIIENIPEGIIVKNVDNLDFKMVNRAAEDLFGYSRAKLLGNTDYDFFTHDEANFFTQKDREVIKSKKLVDIPEETLKTKNVGQKILHTKKIPILNSEGNPQYLLGISEDITELKMYEKALIESEGLLRDLFDNMPSGISVYQVKNDGSKGTDYIIKEFNRTSQEIEGMKREEVIGKSLYEIRPNIDEYGIIPIFKKVWETGEPTHYPAKIYVDENYSNYYENYVFKAPTGEVVAIYNDVTDQEKGKEKIQKSLKEKDVLLREVHHRVKNNLQIIASLLHLQERSVDDEETLDVLKESQGRVKSMAVIHEKLYQSPTFNNINFKQYTEKLVYDIIYSYGVPPGTIKTQLNIDDININIDTAMPLGLIINELVTNSVKYAFPQSKGTITIQLKSLPEQMELTIADNGMGLSKNINLKNTDTLGLQLVNSLIGQIDGQIEINRTNGTEFKITFNELEYKERL